MPATPRHSSGTACPSRSAARRTAAAAGIALALALGSSTSTLAGQAAVDPNMAPRAAALERAGDRLVATDMLGRYLATAQDDGKAWFQLGRFYILDARDWHFRGHVGDPDGQLYLDLAVVAFDQAVRLMVDSAGVYRSLAEMDRALLFVEDSGWAIARERRPRLTPAPLPTYIVELGVNLLNSCPQQGVLLTGGQLETAAVWYASLESGYRKDILPLRPDLYSTDSIYRRRMAADLGVDPALAIRAAMAQTAGRRPVCFGPMADTAAAPMAGAVPVRLVRVIGVGAPPAEVLTVGELLKASRLGGTVWTRDVMEVYSAAARFNPLLCGGLLLPLGNLPPRGCGK
jgi:hypothetical protein